MSEQTWPDILCIDKPSGITSFDVIRRLRARYRDTHGTRAPKMGHAGTLDPLASGLMLVGVGSGTKRLHELQKRDKEYDAEILLGEQRDTGDLEGTVCAEKPVDRTITEAELREALARMVGVLVLPVPAYSALKQGGVPLYKKARSGVAVHDLTVPEREMVVHAAELRAHGTAADRPDRYVVSVRFYVGSGTYIRSLAQELGRRLGYPATLRRLRRTRIGEYSVKNAEAV